MSNVKVVRKNNKASTFKNFSYFSSARLLSIEILLLSVYNGIHCTCLTKCADFDFGIPSFYNVDIEHFLRTTR